MNNVCRWCGNHIAIAIFKGEDWCSELCRKALEAKEIKEIKEIKEEGGLFDRRMAEWRNNPPIIVPPDRLTNAQKVEEFAEMLKEAATGLATVGVSEEDILDGGLKGALDLAQEIPFPNSKRRYLHQKFEATDSVEASEAGVSVSSRSPGWGSVEVSAKEWRCPRCNSNRWVSASLNGGLTRIKQCVPCGHFSSDLVDGEDEYGHQELKATGDTPDSVAAGAYWLRRVDKTPYRHYPCNVPLKDLTEAGDEVEWWECPACGKHTSGKRLFEEGEHRG